MFYTTTIGPPDVPPWFLVLKQACDWSGANRTRDCRLLLQHERGVTDGTRVGQFRKPPRALGLRDCSRVVGARSGVCFFMRSSASGLGSTRTPHTVRALRHGRGPVQNAPRRGCPWHSSACTFHARWLPDAGKSSMRGAVASSFAWNWSKTWGRQSILTTASGSTKCVPFAHGDRWRRRHVLTDRCKCSVRHCVGWRDVLSNGSRCCAHERRQGNV